MQEIKQLKLKNGFRVVAVDAPGRYAGMVELFVEMGSKYETEAEAGLSHFIEHMTYKGTTKRPTAYDINKELDGMGVGYNAGTGYECTSYHIKSAPGQLMWAGEFLNDIVLNSTFTQSELEKERGVVLEEIAMYQDTPSAGLSSDFYAKFIKSNIGCWNIIGNEPSLRQVNSQTMHEFRNRYFDPKRCVFVVVVDFKKVENLNSVLENIAKDWEHVKNSSQDLPVLFPKLVTFNETIGKDVDQAHFCLGWPGVKRQEDAKHMSRIVELLLCGNFSSRLISLLREEMGVAYYVNSITEGLGEFGVMGIQAGVKMSEVDSILDRTKQEILNLSSWITPETLGRAKDYLVGTSQLAMDKVSFWSEFIGQKLLLDNELGDMDKEIELYKAIDYEEVISFCKMNLVEKNISSLVLKR